VGYLERRRDDEEEEVYRFLIDRLEVDAVRLAAERDAEPVHDERAAVGDRDAAADAGGTEILAPLQHLEQHSIRLLVQLQQRNQLFQDVVFRRTLEIELNRVLAEEFSQFHLRSCLVQWAERPSTARAERKLRSYRRWQVVSNADVAW